MYVDGFVAALRDVGRGVVVPDCVASTNELKRPMAEWGSVNGSRSYSRPALDAARLRGCWVICMT